MTPPVAAPLNLALPQTSEVGINCGQAAEERSFAEFLKHQSRLLIPVLLNKIHILQITNNII
jgi:hypothetical protein